MYKLLIIKKIVREISVEVVIKTFYKLTCFNNGFKWAAVNALKAADTVFLF